MATIDLHDKPFGDETITKLEIFEDYAQAWLPTFIMQNKPILCIIDFFAGTGYDKNGIAGSPIRLLKKIVEHKGIIFQNKTKIKLYLNEFEPNKKQQKKYELLKTSCEKFLEEEPSLKHIIDVEYLNLTFEIVFEMLLPVIRQYPALVYLDQNGIKFTSEKYFLELEKTTQTDFLYFISSSYFWRFGDRDEFKMNLNIDMNEARKNQYKFIHNSIIEQLRKKLPENSKLRLYPFSLKKGQNIHGIIFGASHPRAVDKFLNVAWSRNKSNGMANFDIYDEAKLHQIDMFSGDRGRSRIEIFQDQVREMILSGNIDNNFDLYNFAIGLGFLGSHAAQCVTKMKKEKVLIYDCKFPLVNYENTYKKPKKLLYLINQSNKN